jgi:polyhydroxyalkanoate synthesis regulator phasin
MKRKHKVVVGAAAAVAVAGGGGAIAATKLDSPSDENQAVVNDAAKKLGVAPSALSNALEQALENRVDAAVAAGRLTKEEGDALKARIESGDFPYFGLRDFDHGPFGHHGDDLAAAASYLGLTEQQLDDELGAGKTLAQIAKDHGKSVDGLVDALYAAEKKELDQAVADGRLTKEQEQSMLGDLKQRITNKVNGTFGPRFGFRFRHGFEAPPPAFHDGTT